MSVTSGFFNSKDGDRKYDAEQMSSIFDGLISDGVYSNKTAVTSLGNPINQAFKVTANGGMDILVGTGRAWFNHTWTLNDNLLVLTVSASDQTLPRIDAVVIEVNTREEVRTNTIKIVKGTASSNPVRPAPANVDGVYTHAIAYIRVAKGVTEITSKDIDYVVGSSETPYVGGLLKDGIDVEPFLTKWDDAVADKIQEMDDQVSAKVRQLETAISQATSGAVVDGSVKTSSIEDGAVTIDKLAWNAVRIRWRDIVVTKDKWGSSSRYAREDGTNPYPKFAKLPLSNVNGYPIASIPGLEDMTPEVIFHPDSLELGVLAPVCAISHPTNNNSWYFAIYATAIPDEDVKVIEAILWT